MRHTITTESEVTIDNWSIEPGSLKWEEDKVYPVTLAFDHENIIARASDIRREDDGRITAEIEMIPRMTGEVITDMDTGLPGGYVVKEPEIPEGLFPSISVSDIEAVVVDKKVVHEDVDNPDRNLMKIVHCKLRTIALTPNPAWPRKGTAPGTTP